MSKTLENLKSGNVVRLEPTRSDFEVHFGGPDKPVGALRNLLSDKIDAVPAGGSIEWITYYFRDRALARKLVEAAARGVKVTLVLEGKPRIVTANQQVISILSGEKGLADGLRIIALPGVPSPSGIGWKPQLHEKIYCFSHPRPTALFGSFNPSGDIPEDDPAILWKIGNHNIAHNALVETRDAKMVAMLAEHIRSLHRDGSTLYYRFWGRSQSLDFGHTVLHFWPRIARHPIEVFLQNFGKGSRVRIAASHIRFSRSVSQIINLSRRGAQVEVLSEFTNRRVPLKTEQRLKNAGVRFERFGQLQNVPMHLKLILAENEHGQWAAFGSFNWTMPSYLINHEIAAVTSDAHVFAEFDRRWNELRAG
ncbi:MAG: phospholipase D-like domain-containing protein [Lysobacterales bacterium]